MKGFSMARPERNNVDYFPLYCDNGRKMFFIETKYGNNGYAAWLKILTELAKANYHYLNLQDETQLMYISALCKITIDELKNIINDLVKLGEFNAVLWDKASIIFSDKFVESISDAYKKRSNEPITLLSLVTLLKGLGVLKQGFSIKKRTVNPQSILEDSIEDDSIVKEKDDYDSILENYHSTCTKLPKIIKITETRKSTIKARIEEYDIETILQVFKIAAASDFLNGKAKKWRANFDWLMRPNNFVKVLEGSYDNVKGKVTNAGPKHGIGVDYKFD